MMNTTKSTTAIKFNPKCVAQIAMPAAHEALFTDYDATQLPPIAKYLMSETCTALSHWLWIAKTSSTVCAFDYNLSLVAMRASVSMLPFVMPHEKSFGWLRGLGSKLPEFAMPTILFEHSLLGCAASRTLAHSAQLYAERLCQNVGAILYGYAKDLDQPLWEIFELSETDRAEIIELYLRYLAFAMDCFAAALQAPAPYLVAYPYEIDMPRKQGEAPCTACDFAEPDAFEKIFLFESYVPSIPTYCVFDAATQLYQHNLVWDEESASFCPLFTDGFCTVFDDFFADETDEMDEAQTPLNAFLCEIEEQLHQSATEEDFEPLTAHICDESGDSLFGLFDTDYEDAAPFDDDEEDFDA